MPVHLNQFTGAIQNAPELRFNFFQLVEIYHQPENSPSSWKFCLLQNTWKIDLSFCANPPNRPLDRCAHGQPGSSLEIWIWRQIGLFYSRVPTSLISSRQRKRTRRGPRLASCVAFWAFWNPNGLQTSLMKSCKDIRPTTTGLLLLYGQSKRPYKIFVRVQFPPSAWVSQGKFVKQGPKLANSSIINFDKLKRSTDTTASDCKNKFMFHENPSYPPQSYPPQEIRPC